MYQYDVFLSYISQDAETMWRVYKDLEVEGLKVWIDQTNLEPGTLAWDRVIEEAIMQAGCLVVILSPNARTAEWVREELHYAKALGKRIFPLLAYGDAQNSIPFGFSTSQWTDIRDDAHYHDGLNKLIRTICKTLNIESRSQRRERREAEMKRAEIIDRYRRQVEQARRHVEDLARQHSSVIEEITNTVQEEKGLRHRLEFLQLQAEQLQEDLKTIEAQQDQAHQLFHVANANYEAIQNDLQSADEQGATGEYIRYVDPNHDWSMDLPQLAELSEYDETSLATTAWQKNHRASEDETVESRLNMADLNRLEEQNQRPQLPAPSDARIQKRSGRR